ncbi:MAG: hypothetical protein SFY81_10515 [Verrucomicrobiota bacterium]|nr:hypothetical protein [Verrucomicrobiota bacterium]
MKKMIKGAILACVAGTISYADTAVFNLDLRIDGTDPWQVPSGQQVLSATFTDVGVNEVELTMRAHNTAGGWVRSWCFEFYHEVTKLEVVPNSTTYHPTDSSKIFNFLTDTSGTGLNVFRLDFGFDFGTSPSYRFGSATSATTDDEWVTLRLRGKNGTTIDVQDFLYMDTATQKKSVYTAAHIQGLNGNPSSVKVGDKDVCVDCVPVPEPATIAGGVVLGALALGHAVRRNRK